MLKKILVFLVILICLATAAVYCVTRPRVLSYIVKSVVNANVRAADFMVKDLIFEEVRVDSGGIAAVEGVAFKVLLGKNEWSGEIPVVYIKHSSVLNAGKNVTVDFHGARVRGKDEEFKDVALKIVIALPVREWQSISGHVRVGSLTVKGVSVTEFDAQVKGEQGILTADSWSARWAGGSLSGRLIVKSDGYKLQMDARGIDLSEMGETILGKMRGRVEGTIDLQGQPNDIGTLKGHLNAPDGAQMRAAVLSLLLPYIPASREKTALAQLIARNSNVFFDQADMAVENVRDDALQLHVKLFSHKLNLDIDVAVDVNMEGGFQNILNRLYQLPSRRDHGS